MKRNLRGISRIAAVGLVILVLVVAGSAYYLYYTQQGKAPQQATLSGTLNVAAFSGYDDAALNQIAKDFMAKYPNVTVNILGVPYGQAVTKYLSVFQNNLTTYDIVALGSVGFMGSLYPYLLDLRPYLNNTAYFPASYNMSDVLPSLISLYGYKGAVLGLPQAGGAMLFYYRPSFFNNATNQQLFQQQFGYQLQVPTTLSQVADIAKFAKTNGFYKYGIILMSGSDDDDASQTYLAIMSGLRVSASSQYGAVTAPYGVLFDSNGRLLLNSSIGVQALTTYVQLIKYSEAPLSASYSTTPGYFAAGDAPMMIWWNPAVFYLNNPNKSTIVGDWMVAPRMPGGYSVLGGTGLAIAKNTQNKQLALTFLAFATSPNESVYFNKLDSLMPFRYSVFNNVVSSNPAISAQINNVASTMTYSVEGSANIPTWPQISTIFRTTIPSIYNGAMTPQQAANAMAQQIASISPQT
ncbi:MAG: extracellular solute-binding protein [Conexivisphaerales archaeon]